MRKSVRRSALAAFPKNSSAMIPSSSGPKVVRAFGQTPQNRISPEVVNYVSSLYYLI